MTKVLVLIFWFRERGCLACCGTYCFSNQNFPPENHGSHQLFLFSSIRLDMKNGTHWILAPAACSFCVASAQVCTNFTVRSYALPANVKRGSKTLVTISLKAKKRLDGQALKMTLPIGLNYMGSTIYPILKYGLGKSKIVQVGSSLYLENIFKSSVYQKIRMLVRVRIRFED